jgi:hypothetical protein
MVIVLILCSVGWLLSLLLAFGTLIGTVSVSAGKRIQSGESSSLLYAHMSFFPAVIIGVIGAWIAALLGVWTITYLCLALPLVSVCVFAFLLWRG